MVTTGAVAALMVGLYFRMRSRRAWQALLDAEREEKHALGRAALAIIATMDPTPATHETVTLVNATSPFTFRVPAGRDA